jgi:hypothetical protein
MKKLIQSVKKFVKDVWLGFTLAEEYRSKSQWGKF